jgi:hypothetical protein
MIHLSQPADGDVERLLAPVCQLDGLSLRGTPIDDGVVRRLLHRLKLKHLDVVDTGVERDAVLRIAQDHPSLRLLPNLAAVVRAGNDGKA